MKYFNFAVRFITATILLQTLFFKFTAAAESVDLFSAIVGADNEAFLRITTGVLELIAGTLILFPKTQILGSIKVLGIMLGAILSHIFILGVDGLFIAAVVAFSGAGYTLWINRTKINFLGLL